MKNLIIVIGIIMPCLLFSQPLILNTSDSGGSKETDCIENGDVITIAHFYTNGPLPKKLDIHTGHPDVLVNIRLVGTNIGKECSWYRYQVEFILDIDDVRCQSGLFDYNTMTFDVGLFVGSQCLFDFDKQKKFGIFDPECYSAGCGGTINISAKVCCFSDTVKKLNVSSDINVFPNPFVDNLNITNMGNVNNYKIYNVLGELIYMSAKNSTEPNVIIYTSQFDKGLYFLNIEYNDTSQEVIRLIKE